MRKSTQYWVVGCASGCALVVLGIVALFAGTTYFVKNTMEGFEQAVEARQTLTEEYGRVSEFVPWPDGAVPAERLEAFLTVREAMAPAREKVIENLEALPSTAEEAEKLESKPFFEKMQAVFDLTRSSVGLGAEMGALFEARNRALLDQEMGLGEYTYLYVVAYYLYLGHPMDDQSQGLPIPNTAARRLPGEMMAMLKNQLAALPDDAGSARWKARLADEIGKLEQDRDRLPWQDGLPETIAASLEPYQERLEESWAAKTNSFELLRNERRSGFSVRTE